MKPKVYEHSAGIATIRVKNKTFAAVTVGNSSGLFAVADKEPSVIKGRDEKKKEQSFSFVAWGEDNNLPNLITTKVNKLPDMARNMQFNIEVGYGQGIVPVYINRSFDGNVMTETITPAVDAKAKEVMAFFENNDISLYLLEQLADLNYFWNTFPEIILSNDKKVVEIRSKEAMFSRWCVDKSTGKIVAHAYSAKWGIEEEPTSVDQCEFTDVLDERNTVIDLKRRLGLEPALGSTDKKDSGKRRFIVPVTIPSPGRTYYQLPVWYSLIESGWFDFACSIPAYKKARMKNQISPSFVIYIHPDYWTNLFAAEGINDDEAKKARRKKEYENIGNFLSGEANSGKATFLSFDYSHDGKEKPLVKIVPVENPNKDGEYIEDSEEVSNIIAYGMGVHSSLIGSHGKGGTINGTEARELFIIKQAMMKPLRDRLLKPFYLIKAINNWPAALEFVIPNLQLTTLDKNTGAQKNIGNGTI